MHGLMSDLYVDRTRRREGIQVEYWQRRVSVVRAQHIPAASAHRNRDRVPGRRTIAAERNGRYDFPIADDFQVIDGHVGPQAHPRSQAMAAGSKADLITNRMAAQRE